MNRPLLVVTIVSALVIGPAAPVAAQSSVAPEHEVTVSTSVPTAAIKIVKFPNCTALNKAYRGGVAKVGVKGNRVSGVLRPFKVKPTFHTALYTANARLDRDRDGIACEKS